MKANNKSPSTRLESFEDTENIGEEFHETTESVWDMLQRIASQIPDEEWEKLPTDLSGNLDYYLYGGSKN